MDRRLTRMNAAVLIDFGQQTTDAQRRRVWDQPAGSEEKIDDVVLADHDSDENVGGGSGGEVGERDGIDVLGGRQQYDHADHVADEHKREKPPIDVEGGMSDVAHDPALALVRDSEGAGCDVRVDRRRADVANIARMRWRVDARLEVGGLLEALFGLQDCDGATGGLALVGLEHAFISREIGRTEAALVRRRV